MIWPRPVTYLKGIWRRALTKIWTTIAPWLVRQSVIAARKKLGEFGSLRILVDVTVKYHAVTHETLWVQPNPYTGYEARVPVHSAHSDTRESRNIKYLAGIAELARTGSLTLLTSADLENEEDRQPADRFRGYGYSDHSLFSGLRFESIDGYFFPTVGPTWLRLPSPTDQHRQRLQAFEESFPAYGALVKVLGRKNSADAWHLFSAEQHDVFCYLTMDFAFVRAVRAQEKNTAIRRLRTKVMTPEDFARKFGIRPISPHILSYENASFPVHPELSMPGQKRRPRSQYRSKGRG